MPITEAASAGGTDRGESHPEPIKIIPPGAQPVAAGNQHGGDKSCGPTMLRYAFASAQVCLRVPIRTSCSATMSVDSLREMFPSFFIFSFVSVPETTMWQWLNGPSALWRARLSALGPARPGRGQLDPDELGSS